MLTSCPLRPKVLLVLTHRFQLSSDVQEIVRPSIGNELALDNVANGLVDPRDMLMHIRSRPQEEQYRLLERLNAIVGQHEGRLLDSRAELIEYLEAERLWEYHIREDRYQEVWGAAIQTARNHQNRRIE